MKFAPAQRFASTPAWGQPTNITSLVDIMLVLVLYLAFAFATQSSIITETRSSALPTTTDGHMDTTGLHLVLAMDAIRVENTQVADLDNGVVPKGGDARLSTVRRALEQASTHALLTSTNEESLINRPSNTGWVTIDAVDTLPYATIEAVTRAAQAAGLTHFRFVVHAKR